jgi:hypothetical protein
MRELVQAGETLPMPCKLQSSARGGSNRQGRWHVRRPGWPSGGQSKLPTIYLCKSLHYTSRCINIPSRSPGFREVQQHGCAPRAAWGSSAQGRRSKSSLSNHQCRISSEAAPCWACELPVWMEKRQLAWWSSWARAEPGHHQGGCFNCSCAARAAGAAACGRTDCSLLPGTMPKGVHYACSLCSLGISLLWEPSFLSLCQLSTSHRGSVFIRSVCPGPSGTSLGRDLLPLWASN